MIGAMSFEKVGVAPVDWADNGELLPANKITDTKNPFQQRFPIIFMSSSVTIFARHTTPVASGNVA